jgi:hypothetical protein
MMERYIMTTDNIVSDKKQPSKEDIVMTFHAKVPVLVLSLHEYRNWRISTLTLFMDMFLSPKTTFQKEYKENK